MTGRPPRARPVIGRRAPTHPTRVSLLPARSGSLGVTTAPARISGARERTVGDRSLSCYAHPTSGVPPSSVAACHGSIRAAADGWITVPIKKVPGPNLATTVSRFGSMADARLPSGHARAGDRLRRRHGRHARAVRSEPRARLPAARPLPRGAGPQPPRRDRGRPRLDDRGRSRGARDRHVPGVAAEAGRMGPRGPHRGDQPQGRPDRPQRRRRAQLRGRLDRPDRLPARQRRPDLGEHHASRSWRWCSRSRRAALLAGRRRPGHHRDRAGHPRGQGGDLRDPRGVQGCGPQRPDPVQRVAAAPGRQDAARHRHQRGAGDARGAARRRDRPQLLDRPRGHARCDPVPRRAVAGAGALHPQRRAAAPGPQRRDDLPRATRAAGSGARRVRRALRHLDRRRLLRDDAGPHRGARRSGPRPRPGRASAAATAAPVEHDRRHYAGPGPGAHAGRRAGELAGLPQGQGAAAGRRLRRDPHDRRGPGGGRRARARRVRGADRAPGRGRADAPGRQADLADSAGPDPGRLDRARGDRDRARSRSRAERSSTRSTSRPAAPSSTGSCRSPAPTAPR